MFLFKQEISSRTNSGGEDLANSINRDLIHTNDGELEATIYHEFLHGILGKEEGHGPRFQEFEGLLVNNKRRIFLTNGD